jgi:hypothetical protein
MRIQKRFQKDPKYTTDGSKEDWKHIYVDIITPSDVNKRGSQLGNQRYDLLDTVIPALVTTSIKQ